LRKNPEERFQKIKDVGRYLRQAISILDEPEAKQPEISEQRTVIFGKGVSTNTISQSISEQRRQTTILFADFSVLTDLFEDFDPEEASEIINKLWSRLDGIIQKGGGRIDKRLSDVFIAVWGAEAIQEDDPERAIRTAIDLQNEVGKYFSKNLSGQFEDLEEVEDKTQGLLKIGISTGMILLGVSSDSGEFLTTGSAVNTAKRLQQNAPVGGILVSHDTYRHVRGVFDVEAFELEKKIGLKRDRKKLKVYQVKRAKPRAFRLRGRDVEGIETKLVGRKGELERMLDSLYTVLEDGEMDVLTIVGEAGLGKSRLLFEFRDRIELLPDKVRVFNARAAESTSGSPFSLLQDIFSLRFEIQDSDSRSVAREKLVKGLLGLSSTSASEFGTGEEAEMKAHFIGQLIGLDFSASPHIKSVLDEPQQIRTRAIYYASQFFAAIAKDLPILLYLDDLHWADDESLEFFERLMNYCADSRMLILNFTRPLLFERKPHWGEGQENHARITLQPLTKRESRQMVKDILQMLKDLPQNLRDLIVANAEGNPFYVEELIKMFIDRGAIVKGAEIWSVNANRLGKTIVPPTLNGVLQARLDRLPEWEKVILQRASVIGREFWDSALESFGTEKNVSVILESLRRKELIFRHETSVFSDANEYIFKHALLRDVTYETVLLRERRELHAKAAEWLIKSSGEREIEYAATIAEHFKKAQDFERSADWYGRAGEQARKTHAPQIASVYYQKAIKLLDSLPEISEQDKLKKLVNWNKGLGEVYQLQAKFTESIEAYNSMLESAENAEDVLSKAHAYYGLTVAQFEQGDTRIALESSNQAIRFASQSGSSAEANKILADALFREARVYVGLGDFEKAIELSNKALEVTGKLGDAGINEHAKNLHILCVANHSLGRFEQAIEFQEQGLKFMRESGNQQNVAYALNALGVVQHARGDFEKAIDYYNESLEIMKKLDNKSAQIMIISNIGGSQIALGEYKNGEQKLRQVLEMVGGDNHFILSETYHFLAQSLLGQNRIDEALKTAQISLNIAQESENTEIIGVAWRGLGMIASHLQKDIEAGGENVNAEKCFEKSLQIFTENKMEAERGHTLKSFAQHVFDQGDKKRADDLMNQAGEVFK
jgi:predicted ATPase/class 3 adenylate cyclase